MIASIANVDFRSSERTQDFRTISTNSVLTRTGSEFMLAVFFREASLFRVFAIFAMILSENAEGPVKECRETEKSQSRKKWRHARPIRTGERTDSAPLA